jgi:putative oxidoreductase
MWLFRTDRDVGSLILRIYLAVFLFGYGGGKVLGLFGGRGLEGAMHYYLTTFHLAAPFAALSIATEFLGAIALVVGLLTRVVSFAVIVNMLVAMSYTLLRIGFFMPGKKPIEGFELHLSAIAIALALLIRGAGIWSVDRAIAKRE